MAFNPTNEQQNALDANGKVLVCAAAGSGKTAVLVERVANHIINGNPPCDADRLAVVTFTNAAASEMRKRISKSILDELRKNPTSLRLKRQQFLLNKASISTIDSFCINLVREYFYKLDVSPDFKIVENSILSQIHNKSLSCVTNRYFAEKSESFLRLVDLVGAERAEKNLRDAMLQIYTYLRSLPFVEQYIELINKMYSDFSFDNSEWIKVIFDYATVTVSFAIDKLKGNIRLLQEDEVLLGAYAEGFNETLVSLERLKESLDKGNWDDCFNHCKYHTASALQRVSKYPDEDFKKQFQNARKSAEGVFTDMSKLFFAPKQQVEQDISFAAPALKTLFEMVMEFWNLTETEKKAKNCMDFADVEYAVLKLLVEYNNGEIKYTDIAKELSNRYYEVLVDEYQDTNDLQDTIFKALSNGGKNLFMVGDVKQSIYRFRQANPQNFLNNRQQLPNYVEGALQSKIIMSGNFRSAPQICDFVNFTYRLIMSQAVGQMDYTTEDELVAKAEFSDISKPRVQLHIIDKNSEKVKNQDLEPYHLAQFVKQTVNGEAIIKDGDKLRCPKYSDIAILLRGRTDIPTFVKAFRDAGIPVWADEKGGFLQAKEIVTILSLLNIIDNPTRDIPLLSLLMSDLYSFTPDEIAQMRINNRNTDLYSALLQSTQISEKSNSFLEDIKKYRQWSVSMPINELIRRIYDSTGYINTVQLYENGAQARANLILLAEYARSYESNEAKGLSRFLKYIERVARNSENLNQAAVITEADDAVKIMTMHRSKGLQFPICILAELSTKLNKSEKSDSLQQNERLGVGLKIKDVKRHISYSTVARDAISIENERLSMSEELRVLYVAMTRAQDIMVLSVCLNNVQARLMNIASQLNTVSDKINPMYVLKTENYANLILASAMLHPDGKQLRELSDLPVSVKEADSNLEIKIIKADEIVKGDIHIEARNEMTADMKLVQQLSEQLSYKYPYEKLNFIAAKQSASALAHSSFESEYSCSEIPLFLQGEKISSAQKGTAMHKFMQYTDFQKAKTSLDSEISRLFESGYLNETEVQCLNKKALREFFESELYNRMEKSQNIQKERRFMVELPATDFDSDLDSRFDNEHVVVQGVVDCIFEEDQKLVIVDYKTDRVNNIEELKEKYSVQLKIYEKAVSEVFNIPVKQSILYSFHLSNSIII